MFQNLYRPFWHILWSDTNNWVLLYTSKSLPKSQWGPYEFQYTFYGQICSFTNPIKSDTLMAGIPSRFYALILNYGFDFILKTLHNIIQPSLTIKSFHFIISLCSRDNENGRKGREGKREWSKRINERNGESGEAHTGFALSSPLRPQKCEQGRTLSVPGWVTAGKNTRKLGWM